MLQHVGVTLFPSLPRASFQDLMVVLLIIGLMVSPFVIHDQLRRRRVRRFTVSYTHLTLPTIVSV